MSGRTGRVPSRFDILDKENLNREFGIKNAPGDTFNDGLDHGLARFWAASFIRVQSVSLDLRSSCNVSENSDSERFRGICPSSSVIATSLLGSG